jgi:hypothetical protein
MATKTDVIALKQRKQKMILIAGAVVLAGLLALQGPKLLNRNSSSSSSSEPATTTETTTADGTVTPPAVTPSTGGTTAPPVTGRGPSAEVAGVVLRPAGTASAGTGQLASLTRFRAKDPFVPQVAGEQTGSGTTDGGTAATTGAPTGSGKTEGNGTTTGTTGGAIVTPSTETPVAFAYATVLVNGKPQQLQVKQVFPKGQPTFVLTAVAKGFVKIGVAGGKFAGGSAVKLEKGKTVTLMNTSTGQRFVMKLVFTGEQPEQIAGFNPGSGGTTTTTTPTTQGTTQGVPGAPPSS